MKEIKLTEKEIKFLDKQRHVFPKMYIFCIICLAVTLIVLGRFALFGHDTTVKSIAFSGTYFCIISIIFVRTMRQKDISFFKIIERLTKIE